MAFTLRSHTGRAFPCQFIHSLIHSLACSFIHSTPARADRWGWTKLWGDCVVPARVGRQSTGEREVKAPVPTQLGRGPGTRGSVGSAARSAWLKAILSLHLHPLLCGCLRRLSWTADRCAEACPGDLWPPSLHPRSSWKASVFTPSLASCPGHRPGLRNGVPCPGPALRFRLPHPDLLSPQFTLSRLPRRLCLCATEPAGTPTLLHPHVGPRETEWQCGN